MDGTSTPSGSAAGSGPGSGSASGSKDSGSAGSSGGSSTDVAGQPSSTFSLDCSMSSLSPVPQPRSSPGRSRSLIRRPFSGLVGAVALALVVHRTADRVAQLVALRLEVAAVLVVRLDLDRLLRHGREAVAGDPGDLPRGVRQDADRGQYEVREA